MKLSSRSKKTAAAVVTASVSAALATVAFRRYQHGRQVAFADHSSGLPGVGGILTRSPDPHTHPHHHSLERAGMRRALVELELEPPISREETSASIAEEDDALRGFPALEGSTVMFLHIFKRMLVDWAIAEGKNGAIVVSCTRPRKEDKIGLSDHELLDEPVQEEIISRQKVLAGHFLWGFQRHVKRPYVMITSLRNPLEVFVSGKQFLHPHEVESLEEAQHFISNAMLDWLATDVATDLSGVTDGRAGIVDNDGRGRWNGLEGEFSEGSTNSQDQRGGFIFRLTGDDKRTLHGDVLVDATYDAMRNLEKFWVVGVVEQYAGFLEVLRRLLDPDKKRQKLWDKYARKRLNSSPVQTRDILAAVDPELVQRFNNSLALQWKVYEKAVSLWDIRCRQVLPKEERKTMCTVDPPPSTYHR